MEMGVECELSIASLVYIYDIDRQRTEEIVYISVFSTSRNIPCERANVGVYMRK